jgi:TRAP-type mannitol/chloroaromatic compound transport system substrate-binding protein
MERRRFLVAAGGGAAGASGLAAPAIAQSAPKVRWRIASGFPKSLDVIHSGAETFAKALSDMTDGAFTATLSAPGELAPGDDAVEAVAAGDVEACHTCSAYSFGKDPAFALGAAAPFGLNARQMTAWLRSGGRELLDGFYSKRGVVGLPCGNTGAQMGGWFRKPVDRTEDLKGLKIRIEGLGAKVMERLGASPQGTAAGDVAAALEQGGLDAAAWIGPHDDLKLGLNRAAKVYAYPGWWAGGAGLTLFVNRSTWRELPKRYREIALGAASLAGETVLAGYDARNPKALREIATSGVTLKPFPRDLLEAAYAASQQVFADLYAENEWFRTIHEAQTAFRNEQIMWFRAAELPFDSFMAQMQSRG